MSDFPNTQIPENLRELVNAQLMDDETIQWIDQPIRIFFSFDNILAMFFAAFTGAFLLPFLLFCLNGNAEWFLQNMLLETLCASFVIALSSTFSVLRAANKNVKRIVYAITNFRAMIVYGKARVITATSFYPTELSYLSCVPSANGTGHIFFRPLDRRHKHGFVHIRNVVKVERMLQELKRTKSPEQ
jgi:hypothetical protein